MSILLVQCSSSVAVSNQHDETPLDRDTCVQKAISYLHSILWVNRNRTEQQRKERDDSPIEKISTFPYHFPSFLFARPRIASAHPIHNYVKIGSFFAIEFDSLLSHTLIRNSIDMSLNPAFQTGRIAT